MATVLPQSAEVPSLVPGPRSVAWRYAGDARLIATGAYAILLQVAHPTVGAGVSEHSDFRADPWGRLLRTLDYSYVMTYGGPELAMEMGGRIRQMHQGIKGVRPDGERYHALEPGAYAWVHATLAHSIVRGHELLGRPMSEADIERFYAEWRRSGRLIGVRERDLPEGWTAFRAYFDEMVTVQLQRTPAVEEVLEALESPARPELQFLPERAWRLVRIPAVHQNALVTAGLLGPTLRDRFGVPWSRGKERELRLLGAASRAATPLLPPTVRNVGPRYLRWRREQIARGDAAAPTRAPRQEHGELPVLT
ncbi:MAG TPA: oxygenase MpaB family protein [Solirubrobacterales bacterium]|nr:oxygenase MpaB family protein [Solirubrobacterales bacterium]